MARGLYCIRMDAAELEAIRTAAKSAGLGHTTWLRRVALDAARRALPRPAPPPAPAAGQRVLDALRASKAPSPATQEAPPPAGVDWASLARDALRR